VPKVTLKIPSWIAAQLKPGASGWLILERELPEGATLVDCLMNLVADYPGFRETVYNPDTGLPTEQLNFVLNDQLLNFQELSQTRLTNGDTVLLIPMYVGG
jgi:molybdopterin converting factor small subunit